MRTPLIERLDENDPQLALFDERASDVDGRPTRRPVPEETKRAKVKRMRRWRQWCLSKGYQWEPQFITSTMLWEWTLYMSRVQRYAPGTINQALWVLERAARAAGAEASRKQADAVLADWRKTVRAIEKAKAQESRSTVGEAEGEGPARH